MRAIEKDAAEFKDKYLRSIAEAENLRKRLHKERHEMTQLSIQSILIDFLNPIDHMENALAHTNNASDEVKNWAIGFKMILNQFKEVLASNDVHPFKSVGTHFDPHNHEAVEVVETKDYPDGTVIEESLRGYKMGSKTIRAARVKVSKYPSRASKEDEEKETENNE
ncbi:MAG: nucleotide exchange factor GrpE [Parachlamydiaceae bacterium]|nr:MAG: nucleotide exchange factor GrpE [Parachlamydiaceae bacterium]